MPDPPRTIFRFGPFESRPRTRELYKHEFRLKIRPQPLQVLNLLLSRAGDAVSREEFRQQLWSSETFVDFEHSLNNSINELRSLLSDSPSEPRYIETLPRLGYRFVAPVECIEGPADLVAHPPLPAIHSAQIARSRAQITTPTSGLSGETRPAGLEIGTQGDQQIQAAHSGAGIISRPARALVVVFGLLVVGLAGVFLATHHQRHPANQATVVPSGKRTMVAVLPFENLTGDATQDYFSDGLTEEMIAQLGRVQPERLAVIARTSVMHYKHNDEPLEQIGRELGVQYVLEGSVRRDAGKVRIGAKLIQMKDQRDIWSQQYDRELSGLLTLQGEIATEISDEIQHALGEREQNTFAVAAAALPAVHRPPKSYEAYGDYLKGRYFWNMRTARGFQQGITCFQQSIAKDPTYAPAYAGLADSYALLSAYGAGPASELIPKARAAALKALSLDDNLAEAHVSLAVIAQNYDWDWQTSEKEFRRAIALDPNYATGHHWYAEHLALLGRYDEADVEMERARQLDPLSLIIQTDTAVFLYFARRYDQAINQFRAVIEREPNFPRTNILAFAYVQDGRYDDALAEIKKWRQPGDKYWILPLEARLYTDEGRHNDARLALENLQDLARGHRIEAWAFAQGYAGVEDKDQVFIWLQKSIDEHSPGLTALKVDPAFDPVRTDPRFQRVLRHIGLNQ